MASGLTCDEFSIRSGVQATNWLARRSAGVNMVRADLERLRTVPAASPRTLMRRLITSKQVASESTRKLWHSRLQRGQIIAKRRWRAM